MNERAVAAGLIGVLVLGLAIFFFNTYEKVPYEHYIPPRGDASQNPLLGAQRLLEQLEYDVVSRKEFAPQLEMPATTDTILLPVDYDYLEESQLDDLLAWVASGGHLIVQIQRYLYHDYDPIFTAVGVTAVIRDRLSENGDAKQNSDTEVIEAASPWDQSVNGERDLWGTITHDNQINIDFGDNELIWTVHDQFGVFAGQIAYDQGQLTAVADLGFLDNLNIGEGDHAFMLTRLIGRAEDAGRVWLFLDTEFPSLWTLLIERIRFVLIAGGVLALLSLWWAAQRFGPTIAPPRDERKAFIDHVEASGRFLWQHRQGARLLASSQKAFLRDASRRHPALRRLKENERDIYLARICGVAQADASACMQPLQTRSHADFVRQLQTLKTMWTRL